jgi:hypothetical protein
MKTQLAILEDLEKTLGSIAPTQSLLPDFVDAFKTLEHNTLAFHAAQQAKTYGEFADLLKKN